MYTIMTTRLTCTELQAHLEKYATEFQELNKELVSPALPESSEARTKEETTIVARIQDLMMRLRGIYKQKATQQASQTEGVPMMGSM
jgi:5-methylcytosine-specific restriction endonuclease McrBC regulatory subunit McrC